MMKNTKKHIIANIIGLMTIAGILNSYNGVNYFEGRKETYYNKPMKRVCAKASDMGITGEYWEREDGAKMFGTFVIVAAAHDRYPYGSVVGTSLGYGIVLDTGTFAQTNKEQIDIATTW